MGDESKKRSLIAKVLNAGGSAVVTVYDATAELVSKAADSVSVLKPKSSGGMVLTGAVKLGESRGLDFKIKDLERILNAGKKNFKDFESKYDAFSLILRDISILKKQLERNQSGLENKITMLSEQIMDVVQSLATSQVSALPGQSVPQINLVRRDYEKRDYEKIDYEKITAANREVLREFEKRLAAFLSISQAGAPVVPKGRPDLDQVVLETRLSELSKQVAAISKALSAIVTTTANISAQKTDYDKIDSTNKEFLKDFEKRIVLVAAALRDVQSLSGQLQNNQTVVEGKLSALSKQTADMVSALKVLLSAGTITGVQKSGGEKINFESIDYEKIADTNRAALRDLEKSFVPVLTALRDMQSLSGRLQNNQAVVEDKLSGLSKQTTDMVSALKVLLSAGAIQGVAKSDAGKINFESIDYEKIDNVVKGALRGIESKVELLSTLPHDVVPAGSTADVSSSAMEEKLTGLSRQMEDIVSVLNNLLASGLDRGVQAGGMVQIDYEKLGIEKIDYEKIANESRGMLSGLESKLEAFSAASRDISSVSRDISIVKAQTGEVASALEGKLSSLTGEVTTVKGALIHIIRLLMAMTEKK
ncbi:MAG: hypothetical protein H7844_03125 [Nitrospirae bacterium YQR-1]